MTSVSRARVSRSCSIPPAMPTSRVRSSTSTTACRARGLKSRTPTRRVPAAAASRSADPGWIRNGFRTARNFNPEVTNSGFGVWPEGTQKLRGLMGGSHGARSRARAVDWRRPSNPRFFCGDPFGAYFVAECRATMPKVSRHTVTCLKPAARISADLAVGPGYCSIEPHR